MYNKPISEGLKVDNFDFWSDFQILTMKEKRWILKNAKSFLDLQKKGGIFDFCEPSFSSKENKA
jgi:hypothetical protein